MRIRIHLLFQRGEWPGHIHLEEPVGVLGVWFDQNRFPSFQHIVGPAHLAHQLIRDFIDIKKSALENG